MLQSSLYRAGVAVAVIHALAAAVFAQIAPVDRMTASEKGSLLVYSNVEIRWDADGFVVQDTVITLVNDWIFDTQVQLFFVNGDPPLDEPGVRIHPGWNRVDGIILLTAGQPAYWSALTGLPGPGGSGALPPFVILDPGFPPGRPADDGTTDRVLRGFIYAWAVDVQGREVSWNHLTGGGAVYDYRDHAAWEHRAWAAQSAEDLPPGTLLLSPFGRLDLNDQEYVAPPAYLELEFFAVGSTGLSVPGGVVRTHDTDLTLHPVGADLRQGGSPLTTKATFVVWNEDETQFTNLSRCITCWDQRLLSMYAEAGFPNHFLLGNLQTDKGRARIYGVDSFDCDPSDCCVPNGTPGCTDPGCEAAVCAVDPICCDTSWDQACANGARQICGICAVDAALLGVQSRQLVAPDSRAVAGANLTGHGSENAVVWMDFAGGSAAASSPRALGTPTQDRVSAEELGSVLIFPRVELRWDAAGVLRRDTILSIQNVFPESVRVHLVYVNGDPFLAATGTEGAPDYERLHRGWNQVHAMQTLTNDQPTYWSAATGEPGFSLSSAWPPFTWLDPDVSGTAPGRPAADGSGDRVLRGFAYAWAVNEQDQEISFNYLTGSVTIVNDTDADALMYNAYASQSVSVTEAGAPTGTPGAINLDGVEFTAPYSLLLLDFFASGSTAFSGGSGPWTSQVSVDGELTLHPVTFHATGPIAVTRARFVVWNEDEIQFTNMQKCLSCWDQSLLSLWPDASSPNHFQLFNLQTDKGKGRVDGTASPDCPDSAEHALLGVQARRYTRLDGPGRAMSAAPLTGMGTKPAVVTYPPDPADLMACCLVDGSCAMLTPIHCGASGGAPQGTGTTCAAITCPSCGDPAAGSCTATGLAFCFDRDCCGLICEFDPFCCDQFWDTLCVEEAETYCSLCPGDTNDDGEIGVDDLVNIIVFWGTSGVGESPPGTPVLADVAGPLPGDPPDGVVNVNDLNVVIINWGPCP